jgi:hypothetical protein
MGLQSVPVEMKALFKCVRLQFFIATDTNGDPTNATTVSDQYGQPLPVPFEITSVVRTETGLYTITLNSEFYDLVEVDAQPYTPYELLQGAVIGSVNLNTLSLSTLNALTLIIDDDVAAAFTTTFTTPTSVANILTQIQTAQTGASNTSTLAQLVTNKATGATYLKVASKTLGSSSTMLITGTGRATLGMGAGTTVTGQKPASLNLVGFNAKGVDITVPATGMVRPAKSVQLLALDSSFAVAAVKNGGFMCNLTVRMHQ